MRLARKLALLTATALAAMALAATSASAQEGISIVDEATGDPCNPCLIHAAGQGELYAHTTFGEAEVSGCTDEFEAEVYDPNFSQTGVFGHITTFENDHATNDACTRENCAAPEDEWDLSDPVEDSADSGLMFIDLCLSDEQGSESHCNLEVRITEEGAHHQVIDATATEHECRTVENDTHVEISASWEVQPSSTHPAIEIIHET